MRAGLTWWICVDSHFAFKDDKLYSCFGIDFLNDLYDNGMYFHFSLYTRLTQYSALSCV